MLTERDYQQAADKIGCNIETIKAIIQVESSGSGFNKDGTIKLQFEPYTFYKQLKKKFGETKANALQEKYPDLIKKHLGDYNSQSKEHEQLERASTLIDKTCALESASYGMFQVMGFNWSYCGYSSIDDFINEVYSGESGQLNCFVRFVLANSRLKTAAIEKDWEHVAKYYNGAGYKKFSYDKRLQAAYDKIVASSSSSL